MPRNQPLAQARLAIVAHHPAQRVQVAMLDNPQADKTLVSFGREGVERHIPEQGA
jgi:hypothetical protein